MTNDKRYCDEVVDSTRNFGRAVVEYGVVIHKCSRQATRAIHGMESGQVIKYLCTQHYRKQENDILSNDALFVEHI